MVVVVRNLDIAEHAEEYLVVLASEELAYVVVDLDVEEHYEDYILLDSAYTRNR